MNSEQWKVESGLTFPEILIVAALGMLVTILLVSLLVNSSGVFYNQSSKVSQGLGVNDSLSKIRGSIKEAAAVTSGYPVSNPTYVTDNDTLVLRLNTIDSSGNVIQNTYDYIVYHLDGTNLRMRLFPDAQSSKKSQNQVLSGNVSNLAFQYLDSSGSVITPPNAVRVIITLSLSQRAGAEIQNSVATSEANLRND